MFRYLKVQKSVQLAVALISVGLGALMIFLCQSDLPRLMIWCLAAVFAVFGLVRLVRWLTGRGDPAQGISAQGPRVRMDFITGSISCAAAVLLALFSRPLSAFIAFVLGIYVAADGLLSLPNAFNLKKMQFGQWKTVMALAIVPIVLGALMIVLPNVLPVGDNYAIICNIALGLGLVVNGGIGLWTVYCLHKGGATIIEKKK